LETAVNDRNVLAAQNTQLWKLVEKQRTGYNQILKELERIRGERDVYKNRLITLNGGQSTTSDKRHRSTTAKSVPPPPPPQLQKLSVAAEDRPQLLSRESRISLPEEAKHYIANMSDSPVLPSSKSKLSAPVIPLPPSGRESESLEMDDEDDEDNDEQSEDDNAITEDPGANFTSFSFFLFLNCP
jgi:RalA-binding protein 1